MNPLRQLLEHGQSFWVDYIRRSLITGGELRRLVQEDGLRGITSDPTIFQKAIAGSSDYDDAIRSLLKDAPQMDASTLFEELTIEDIQLCADILKPMYDESGGYDGFASLELSPHLAHDTDGSIAEARRLWKKINRPNVMIKVPATLEGIPVITSLVGEGINVNVTLIFSLSQYEASANAYIDGLERCSQPHHVASVASFFLSRIDSVVDRILEGKPDASELRGRTAIFNAKIAYKHFKKIFQGNRWARLVEKGAKVQRLLWASTGTKNPIYSDIMYVEELIGPDTVNTMPPTTFNAFRDHGSVKQTLSKELSFAEASLEKLSRMGVDLDTINNRLQIDGVNLFIDSYDSVIGTLENRRQAMLFGKTDLRTLNLKEHQSKVHERLDYWRKIGFVRKLWAKDPTLWFKQSVPEVADRLGWLVLPEIMHEQLEDLIIFAEKVRSDDIHHIILLGMGGSSLAPEVFQNTFGNSNGFPKLIVLDSTHPSTIISTEDQIDIEHSLFLVSSKSGTTIETLSLFRYFWEKVGHIDRDRGRHFVGITDQGTPLAKLADERNFRRVFIAPNDVGGRFSALTVFGLLPAALIGMNIHELIDRSWIMSEHCAFCVSPHNISSLVLGAALGELAKMGRDKVTFLTCPQLNSFPVWLEQLIAESTGKDGNGIVPVVAEPIVDPSIYGSDRIFVSLLIEGIRNCELEQTMKALEYANHPIITIRLADKSDIGQEIFSWEIAVAAAGALLGINPFNQPNVEISKMLAKQEINRINDRKREESISIKDPESLTQGLNTWINQSQSNDYISIQAYLDRANKTTETIQKIRLGLLNHFKLATTLGYGPRFLHSTGQLHKGGSNNGLFLQVVDEPEKDIPIPETNYTFNDLIQAQSLGDLFALKQLKRRVLRVNLKSEVSDSLTRIADSICDLVRVT